MKWERAELRREKEKWKLLQGEEKRLFVWLEQGDGEVWRLENELTKCKEELKDLKHKWNEDKESLEKINIENRNLRIENGRAREDHVNEVRQLTDALQQERNTKFVNPESVSLMNEVQNKRQNFLGQLQLSPVGQFQLAPFPAKSKNNSLNNSFTREIDPDETNIASPIEKSAPSSKLKQPNPTSSVKPPLPPGEPRSWNKEHGNPKKRENRGSSGK